MLLRTIRRRPRLRHLMRRIAGTALTLCAVGTATGAVAGVVALTTRQPMDWVAALSLAAVILAIVMLVALVAIDVIEGDEA
ncbi:hypothetical protein P7L78_22155 [Tistrella bauzanensis]|uniref:hypothetical protein n=1 Tax=Tistrella TaxID=171436 RepID=UPI0031F614B4